MFKSRSAALAAAVVCTAAAAYAWHEAYEKRGQRRPWYMRFVGAAL